MNDAEIRQAIREARAGHNVQENTLKLYRQYENLFCLLCRRHGVSPDQMPDALQECYFALVEAVRAYDPEKEESSFVSFLGYHVQTACRAIRRQKHGLYTSYNMVEDISHYKKLVSQFETVHGIAPTDKYIMQALRWKPDKLAEVRETIARFNVSSLDIPITNKDGDEVSRAAFIPSPYDLEAEAVAAVDGGILWAVVATLPPMEGEAIALHYRDGLTLENVARFTGSTPQEVRAAQQRGLNKLRHNPRILKFRN